MAIARARRSWWSLLPLVAAVPVLVQASPVGGSFYEDPGAERTPQFVTPTTYGFLNHALAAPSGGSWLVYRGTTNSVGGSYAGGISVDAGRDFHVRTPVVPGAADSGIIAGYQLLMNARHANSGEREWDFMVSRTLSGFSLSYGEFGQTPQTALVVSNSPCITLDLQRTGNSLAASATVDGVSVTTMNLILLAPPDSVPGLVPDLLALAAHGIRKDAVVVVGPTKVLQGDPPARAKSIRDDLETVRKKLGEVVVNAAGGKKVEATEAVTAADTALTSAETKFKALPRGTLTKKERKELEKKLKSIREKLNQAKNRLEFDRTTEAAAPAGEGERTAQEARDAAKDIPAGP